MRRLRMMVADIPRHLDDMDLCTSIQGLHFWRSVIRGHDGNAALGELTGISDQCQVILPRESAGAYSTKFAVSDSGT